MCHELNKKDANQDQLLLVTNTPTQAILVN